MVGSLISSAYQFETFRDAAATVSHIPKIEPDGGTSHERGTIGVGAKCAFETQPITSKDSTYVQPPLKAFDRLKLKALI